ncbi:MAG: hypothetical protein QNK37_29475 [Acidobacteriota bacterium]|nr:hypothetical protein [Acidobacteriota bacterium]
METRQKLYFNGIDLDRAEKEFPYFRQPQALDAFKAGLHAPGAKESLRRKNVADGIDPLRLDTAGWGVILHEKDRHLLEPLQLLLAHRRNQAGDQYFEPLAYRDGDTLDRFLERHEAPLSEADGESLPYYLMIIGHPDIIPFSFQSELDVAYAVGRICFHTLEEYAHYARNVVAHESRDHHETKGLTLFNVENNEPLTASCMASLVAPLEQRIARYRQRHGCEWPVTLISGEQARRERLVHLMGGPETPSVLFTASHGACFSKSKEKRERLQGGLICANWQKPGKVAREDCFCADDLPASADLSGLISFQFACYSAGTPRYDGCRLPDQKQRELHHKPFVAGLAMAMLGRPAGALAVIGHVDQAFQHSFLQHEKVSQVTHFAGTLTKIMRGCPVGFAMEHFNRRLAAVSTALMGRMWAPGIPTEDDRLAHWLAWQDAYNYAVLGDPAVRLGPGEAS